MNTPFFRWNPCVQSKIFLFKNSAFHLIFTALLLSALNVFSQAAGDYRSNAVTMNWTTTASWQKFNGSAWITATDYPGQNSCSGCTIIIQNANTVTVNINPANSLGNIVIGDGLSGTLTAGSFSLNIDGDLTINAGAVLNLATGSFIVGGNTVTSGTIQDVSNSGINLFAGPVIKNGGSWVSSAVISAANMVLKKGFTNSAGSFTAGAATLGDSAALTAVSPMEFKGVVTAMGSVLIDGSGGITCSGTATVAGDLTIATPSALTFTGTGGITISGATIINGSFTDNSNAGINTFTKLVTNNGTFNTDSVTTAGNIRFNGGLLNETGASCSVYSARLAGNITGNAPVVTRGIVTNNGTVTIAGGFVGFAGTGNILFTSALTISSGATLMISTTGSFTAPAVTNAGSFADTDNTSTTTFTGLFTNLGTVDFSALSEANLIFNSGIVHTSGTFNVAAATISTAYGGNDITATSPINFSGSVNFTGNATLSIAGAGGVTFSGNADILIPAALQLAALSSITVSTTGNFTVSTTTSLSGNFTDNDNTGITTFTGLITKGNGTWNSTAVTTPENMLFNGGITQTGGSFTAGGASFPNAATIKSTPVITFNNPIAIGGAGNITISGTGGVVLAGTGIDYKVPGNLSLTGSLTVNTTGNFTVNGTTSITVAGSFTDNDNTGISSFIGLVTHNSTGKWTTTAITTAANLLLAEGFTNTGGIFAAGAATIGDNKTLKGTVNMSFLNGITVTGNADISIAGTATTGVSFGGTLIDYLFRNLNISGKLTVSTTGNFTVAGSTSISSTGNFTDNNNNGITTFTGPVAVGSTATFTTTSVSTIGKLIFAGGITQNNTATGAFSTATIKTTATQIWAGAGNITTAGLLDINAGILTNNVTGTVTAGGTLTGAGTQWIQGTNARLSLNSTNPASISSLITTATGNTIIYGAAGNATIKNQAYYNLTIAGSGSKTMPPSDLVINGTLTLTAGVLANSSSNRNINLSGNWINNAGPAAFVPGVGSVFFTGTSTQTLGGTAITTFKNFVLNNIAGINQTTNTSVTGLLTLTKGNIVTGQNVVSIAGTGAVIRIGGYIAGNEQIYFPPGVSTAKTFDVGDTANYTPVNLTVFGISAAGSITVKSTGTDHPSIAASAINSNLSINRYYTISNTTTAFSFYTAVLNFVQADKDPGINTANVIAGIFTGSWAYPATGTKTAGSIQVTGLNNFGDVALGESKSCSLLNLVINNPAGICLPATANLTAAAVTAGSDTGLIYTYWTNAAASITVVNPAAVTAGNYYVKATKPNTICTAVKQVVIFRTNPAAVINGTIKICEGLSTNVAVSVAGKAPWSGTLSDGTAFSGSSNPVVVNLKPVATTTYTIATLADGNGCTAEAADKTGSAVITLAPLPTKANAGADQVACGETVTLSANTATQGKGNWTIISGTGGKFEDSTAATTRFTGIQGTVYTLRWTIANTICDPSADEVNITLNNLWTGAADSNWRNPANWCSGIVPADTINLNLAAGLPNYPVINDTIIVNHLSIDSGAALSINNSFTIRGTYNNNGLLSNNGTLILSGTTSKNFPGPGNITAMKNLQVATNINVLVNKSFSISGLLIVTRGTIDLDNKYITLQADSAGTANAGSVFGSFSYSRGGRFIVQRYIPAKKAWRLLTVPLTNTGTIYNGWQNAGVYAPGAGTLITGPAGGNGLDSGSRYTLQTFDAASQALVPVTKTNALISPGNTGRADNSGYFLFVQGDRNTASPGTVRSTILSATGKMQTGPQYFNAATVKGNFTLIGNPFPSAINFNTLIKSNLVNRMYVWDPNLNTVGGYVVIDDVDNDSVFSKSVAASSQTTTIASQQAFFIQTASTAPASLTIHETDKINGTALRGFRPSSATESIDATLYLLNADNSIQPADGIRAEFNSRFSNQVDLDDAVKFSNVNENFSWSRNDTGLAIERRDTIAESDTLFLKLTGSTRRSYRYRFVSANLDNHNLSAVLKDAYAATETKLTLNGTTTIDFSVTADSASAASNRFMILFRPTNFIISFSIVNAYPKNKDVAVEWTVAKENGIATYAIEKSMNGTAFDSIGTISPGWNHNAAASYNFTDRSPANGFNFYRIKSTDLNGKITYSQVVKVKAGSSARDIIVYPNPIRDNTINLQFSNKPAGAYTIRLIPAGSGQTAFTAEITVTSNNFYHSFNMRRKLAKGVYTLAVKEPGNATTQQQVIVE